MNRRLSKAIRFGLIIAAASSAACNGPEEPRPECVNDEFPTEVFGDGIEATNLGRFSLRDLASVEGDPVNGYETVRVGIVNSLFSDISAVIVGPYPAFDFGSTDACIGITGLRTEMGDPVPLDVQSVNVDSTGFPSVLTLESPAPGLWQTPMPLDMPVLVGKDVLLDVVGGTLAGEFPSFALTLPAPDMPVVSFPDLSAPVSMNIISDMILEWEPGDPDQDLIEISIDPELPPGSTTVWRLLCYTRDDGCHTLPTEVLQWIALAETQSFSFEFTRHRSTVVELGPSDGDNVVITDLSGRLAAPATR